MAGVKLTAIVTSPLDRCLETAGAIAAGRDDTPFHIEQRLIECGYGEWTGQELKKLAKDPLWKVVQSHPSAVTFPGPDGEALRDVSVRAVDAVREWNAKLGPDAVWVACSHGDVIKAIIADALGMHLDSFQRIVVDPCSVTVINYTDLRPFVVKSNDTGGDLSRCSHRRNRTRRAKPPRTPPSVAERAPMRDSALTSSGASNVGSAHASTDLCL